MRKSIQGNQLIQSTALMQLFKNGRNPRWILVILALIFASSSDGLIPVVRAVDKEVLNDQEWDESIVKADPSNLMDSNEFFYYGMRTDGVMNQAQSAIDFDAADASGNKQLDKNEMNAYFEQKYHFDVGDRNTDHFLDE